MGEETEKYEPKMFIKKLIFNSEQVFDFVKFYGNF